MKEKAELETIKEVAALLLQLGAEQKCDSVSCSIFFRRKNGVEHGLEFVFDAFDICLYTGENGKVFYGLRPGTRVARVYVFPFLAEANIEKQIYPATFWDALWRMVQCLRKYLFTPAPVELNTTLELLAETKQRHKTRPTRETLMLQRILEKFLLQEATKTRQKAKQQNARKRACYEKLLKITNDTPHSLNRARSLFPNLKIRKIAPGEEKVVAQIIFKDYSQRLL